MAASGRGCTACRSIRVGLAAGLTGCAGWLAGLMMAAGLPVPAWVWAALALGLVAVVAAVRDLAGHGRKVQSGAAARGPGEGAG